MQQRQSEMVRQTSLGMRIMLATASVLVFTIGIPLFLMTEQTETTFAWTIKSSLTAAFLGAAYWSSGVLEMLGARERIWVNARGTVPAVLLFTALTLVITIIHIDRFHFDSPYQHTQAGTWAWLIVYAVVPVILGILLIHQTTRRGDDPPRRVPIPALMQAMLVFHALVMIPLGIALLIAPTETASLWPWSLTPLTGRAIGAWLTSIGVAAFHTYWERDQRRVRAMTRSYFVLAILQFIALARYPGEVDWNDLRLWVYLYFLMTILVIGIWGWFGRAQTGNELILTGENV
jgi:hypothetical protein